MVEGLKSFGVLSYPENQQEQNEGLIEAITKVELWKLIYEKYTAEGLDLPSDFWTDIRVWTGLPPEEAKNKTEIVRKVYFEDIKYIRPIIEPKTEVSVMPSTEPTVEISKSVSKTPMDETANLVAGLIRQGAYDIAKQFIDFIKAREEEKLKGQKETPKDLSPSTIKGLG